jgi:hypothetical protein
MKIQQKEIIAATPEKVWNIVTDFSRYPDWNPFIQQISGSLEFDAPLAVSFTGFSLKNQRIVVTGVVPNKYFSFNAASKMGSWWSYTEHVFRIVPGNEDKVEFISEIFSHGLGIKFRKSRLTLLFRNGLSAMNRALKKQCEREG